MPIKIPKNLPAYEVLTDENIFVMDEERATSQEIRPLKLAVLNLMPTKITTETQIIRLLSNTPLQLDLTLLSMESHRSVNTSEEHMSTFYRNFSDIRDQRFDGLIITGAPVENLEYSEVDYWSELCDIMEWSKKNVYSTFHICWAAMAGLYYHYGIEKYKLPKKKSGVFEHRTLMPSHPLLRGFDEEFSAPHSRHTEVRTEDIEKTGKLDILAVSEEAGVYIAASKRRRLFYVMGHSEYDAETLALEYQRDYERGLSPDIPLHYFPNDDPTLVPKNTWRAHAHLLFSNWLNYFVYQNTPYDLAKIEEMGE
ncbi:MAG: homoserine O-succinyltransferase [Clostridiales bacterium]|nr:homoserine O-succinyltransferase [Clostridiales bacterium]